MKKEVKVDGMHCEHCAARVEAALMTLDGVKKVKVNLKKGVAKVECEKDFDLDKVKSVIDPTGFTAVSVE